MLLLFPGGKLNYIITRAELPELCFFVCILYIYVYRQDGSSQRGDLCCILVSDFTGPISKFLASAHTLLVVGCKTGFQKRVKKVICPLVLSSSSIKVICLLFFF